MGKYRNKLNQMVTIKKAHFDGIVFQPHEEKEIEDDVAKRFPDFLEKVEEKKKVNKPTTKKEVESTKQPQKRVQRKKSVKTTNKEEK